MRTTRSRFAISPTTPARAGAGAPARSYSLTALAAFSASAICRFAAVA